MSNRDEGESKGRGFKRDGVVGGHARLTNEEGEKRGWS